MPGLAQVRSPRSSERSRPAQAASSSLSETTNRGPERFCELSLRWGHLAWARWFVAQNSFFRLRKHSSKSPGRAPTTLA